MRATWTMFLAVFAAGCSTGSLEGDWVGDLTCPGGGSAGLELDLDEPSGGETEGTGIVWFYDGYGDYWEIGYDVLVAHGSLRDGAELEVEVDACVEFELGAMDCPTFADSVYGEDSIEGEVDDFFGSSGCEYEIEPD